MARTLIWKELREQWAVWVSMLVVALAGGWTLVFLMSHGKNLDDSLTCLLWLAAWCYGLLSGSLLFAGDREEGTEGFLDILPVTRRQLWRTKIGAGLLLLVTQLLVLIAFACVLLPFRQLNNRLTPELVGIVLFGALGSAWGVFCGSFASSVLAALGWGVSLCFGFSVVLGGLLAALVDGFLTRYTGRIENETWLAFVGLVATGVAVRSRSVYCRTDFSRLLRARLPKKPIARQSWTVVFWLAYRQARGFAIGMLVLTAFAILGLVVLRTAAWPLATLVIGVVAGGTVFADEQQSGAFRFLGDQRFPLMRFWIGKATVRFAVALGACALIALAGFLLLMIRAATLERGQENDAFILLRLTVIANLREEPVWFLTAPLAYGFAVGLFVGLLFRKPLIGVSVAFCGAAPVAFLWLPSQLVGAGLHGWQVLGVPVMVAAASYWLLRSRAADRIVSSGVVGTTVFVAAASILWLSGSFWYRAVEIPEPPDAIDLPAFVSSLPTPEENVGGRAVLRGLRRLAEFQQNFVGDEADKRPPQAGELNARVPGFFDYFDRVNTASTRGWDPSDKLLVRFLDRVFQNGWSSDLWEAVNLPTGVVDDPRTSNIFALLPEANAARLAPHLLSCRGLQAQAEGDPATFVKNLEISLTVSRNMRNHTSAVPTQVGFAVAENASRWVDRWLERLDRRPELLRQALTLFLRFDSEPEPTVEDIRRAEYLIGANTFADPSTLPRPAQVSDSVLLGPFDNVDLMRFSLEVPWEKARFRRLLQAYYSTDRQVAELATEMAPELLRRQIQPFSRRRVNDGRPWAAVEVQVRAALLRIALRLYQDEVGKPAESLTDLVPKYLPAVPKDPYDDKPFRYRLSRGETLRWPPEYYLPGQSRPIPVSSNPLPADATIVDTRRNVPAGQGILWSVGDDRVDNGGHAQQGQSSPGSTSDMDMIFLVPLPPSTP
jgi:ABC-type transport system involved in cytochrome c biogenesis permease component